MFPARYAPILFSFILSILMSCLVSGISTLSAIGLDDTLLISWMTSWLKSWVLAFPALLVVAPMTKKLVGKLISEK